MITIVVSKMTSHCASVRKRDKKVRRDVIKDDSRRWGAVTCERQRQKTLCCRQWTDEHVEHPERLLMRQNVPYIYLNLHSNRNRNLETSVYYIDRYCLSLSSGCFAFRPIDASSRRPDGCLVLNGRPWQVRLHVGP